MPFYEDRPTRRQPDLDHPVDSPDKEPIPFAYTPGPRQAVAEIPAPYSPGWDQFKAHQARHGKGGLVGANPDSIFQPPKPGELFKNVMPLSHMTEDEVADELFRGFILAGKTAAEIERIADKLRRFAWAEERKNS